MVNEFDEQPVVANTKTFEEMLSEQLNLTTEKIKDLQGTSLESGTIYYKNVRA